MEIFYLHISRYKLILLWYKNRNKGIVMQRNNKKGGDINVKFEFKKIMDSNRNIKRYKFKWLRKTYLFYYNVFK